MTGKDGCTVKKLIVTLVFAGFLAGAVGCSGSGTTSSTKTSSGPSGSGSTSSSGSKP